MLEFTYKNGRGRVQLNLENVLPCSASDMRKIISFIDLSDDPEKHATTVYHFISDRVNELKEERESYDENSAAGKENISKVNALMKRYLANAAALVKGYGLPEMTDDAAQIILHAATVYGMIHDTKAGTIVKPFDGWTFKKAGFVFDVRREKYARKTDYIIMLHGTGLECARADKKNRIAAEITPRLIDILTRGAERIDAAKEKYNKLMIDAGYLEPERVEIISETKQEDIDMSDYTFSASSFTCKSRVLLALSICAVIWTSMQEKSERENHDEQVPRVIISKEVPGVFDAFKKNGK